MLFLKVLPFLLFVGAICFFYFKGIKELRSYEFSGVIESIRYDKKHIPYIYVNKKEYYLDANNWSLKGKIKVGDNIVKKKGELTLIIFDAKTGKVTPIG